MYKITFYVPESHCESVKNALFAKGAGKLGAYDCCAWQTAGQGQFRALAGSNPYCGTTDAVHVETEMRVEMVCEDDLLKTVLQALHAAHPYETPAYAAVKIITLDDIT